jgi:uncharacterized protein
MTMLAPVAKADRHYQLDVLRGLGVLGILAVNIGAFAMPFDVFATPRLTPGGLQGAAGLAWQVMYVFFEYKFVTLFSMLFGVSIFLVGGERSDKPRGKLLRRRLFWLAVFGLLHGLLIWFGDILLLYAWAGLFMMLLRSMSPRKLFWIGLTIVILGSALAIGPMFALEHAPAEIVAQVKKQMESGGPQGTPATIQASIDAMRGGLVPALGENLKAWLFLQGASVFVFVWRTVGLMMIGLALFKWGFLTGRSPVWAYLSLVVAGALSLAVTWWSASQLLATDFAFPAAMGSLRAPLEFLSLVITLGYASALILLVKLASMRALLAPLAAAGQMAFTNYLMQSIIMTSIFWSGRGLGLFGDFDRQTLWLFVIGVWALELVWSPLWLSRFRMGPLEWVWRRLTYGKGLAAQAGDDQPQPSATAP